MISIETTMNTSQQESLPEDGPPASTLKLIASRAFTSQSAWIALTLLAIVIVFSALQFQEFVSAENARNVFIDASILMVMAVGATFVIITAGIDLSVGSVLVFASVVAAKLMESVGGNGWGAVLIGLVGALVAGAAWGALNGFLVAKAHVPSLIVTLGTLGMALGAALLLTNGFDLSVLPATLTNDIGDGRLFGQIPYLVIIAFAVALAGGIVLHKTRFGRHTYAIGSNVEAPRRAGINVDRHLITVYAFAGLLSGLAGFLSLALFAGTSVSGHAFDNLQVITAVVLGGTSLFGGVGAMAGTAVGVFIPTVLNNGLVIVGVQPFWQQVAVGSILLVVVYLDQLRRRSQARG